MQGYPAAWRPWWGSAAQFIISAEFVTGNKAVNCDELLLSAGACAPSATRPCRPSPPAEGGGQGKCGLPAPPLPHRLEVRLRVPPAAQEGHLWVKQGLYPAGCVWGFCVPPGEVDRGLEVEGDACKVPRDQEVTRTAWTSHLTSGALVGAREGEPGGKGPDHSRPRGVRAPGGAGGVLTPRLRRLRGQSSVHFLPGQPGAPRQELPSGILSPHPSWRLSSAHGRLFTSVSSIARLDGERGGAGGGLPRRVVPFVQHSEQ